METKVGGTDLAVAPVKVDDGPADRPLRVHVARGVARHDDCRLVHLVPEVDRSLGPSSHRNDRLKLFVLVSFVATFEPS
jgi:hypothetical protein